MPDACRPLLLGGANARGARLLALSSSHRKHEIRYDGTVEVRDREVYLYFEDDASPNNVTLIQMGVAE